MNTLKNNEQNEKEANSNYTVYMHVNKINNKKYIGITGRTPKERWMSNGLGYKGQHFYNAIKKYGWDNFEHIILKENLTQHDACKLETELIEQYDSIKNGYNCSTGGEQSIFYKPTEEQKLKTRNTKKIRGVAQGVNNSQYGISPKERMDDNTYELWKYRVKLALQKAVKVSSKKVICINDGIIHESASKAGSYYKIDTSSITSCCRKETLSCNVNGDRYFFEYYDLNKKYLLFDYIKDNYKNCIICLETSELFVTASDVHKKYGYSDSHILKCCKEKKGTVHGLHFAYYRDYLLKNNEYFIEKEYIKPSKIYQINPTNLHIDKIFDCQNDAELYIGCQKGRLTYLWNNNRYKFHDYYWCKEEDYIKAKHLFKKFGIKKIDTITNKVIDVYVNTSQAVQFNPKCTTRGIRNVLLKKRNTHGGYYWDYVTDDEADSICIGDAVIKKYCN